MPAEARIGDQVTMNCPHGGTGTITSGSPNITANGQAVARVGDTVVCNLCGLSFTIATGSGLAKANGQAVARVDDIVVGTCNLHKPGCPHVVAGAKISSGSGNITIN